ncbi:MAG: Rieske (2Fe-2S) protein [Actinomycetota bacterium]|nr:Rieske (2Fe-2S) protein [Actinomycetota bacterium]
MKKKGGSSRAMGLGFGASAVASIGLTGLYALGGQPQLEGLLLAVSLGGIALGLILWGEDLMPSVPFVEERHELPSPGRERGQAEESFEAGQQLVQRRSFVGKMLGAAVAALGLVALFPIRSLGTRPGPSLYRTPWSAGARLVTLDDEPVLADGLQVNGVLTVFPEGHTDSADAQTLLIRFDAAEAPDLPGPLDWTPEGFIAFSKVCTHAGCPVGLYQPQSRELFCPCHQSVFAVMEGAKPTAGPATRPLPQLPLAIDEEGYVVAQGDYLEPIGPGFWSRGRD